MNPNTLSPLDVLRCLGIAMAVLLGTSCSGVEEKRIRELLNEKGFGTRAQGIATIENYVSGGDSVPFLPDPGLAVRPAIQAPPLPGAPPAVAVPGAPLRG